jgi:DNA-binding response OmpR family regulator
MKVFVCEDDPGISELVQILIKDLGYEADSCSEPETCFTEILNSKPNLIIMDYWLKGVKADEIIKRIRKTEELKAIPMILVSAVADLEEIGDDLEVDMVLRKPFDIDNFQEIIRKFVTK